MAKKIKNLEIIAKLFENKDYTFQDLRLDLENSYTFDKTRNKKTNTNDIRVSYDEAAVRNSIKNLMLTRPGQRFLFPKFGLDLTEFLFEPVSRGVAESIGEKIVSTIKKFEPRVNVERCIINPLFDDNMYDITLILSIPVFGTNFTLNSNLDAKVLRFNFNTRK